MEASAAIAVEDLTFGYLPGQPVLAIETLTIERGEKVFLRGASGSGKSTLLGLIGGVLTPDAGRLAVLGQPLPALRRGARDRFRAEHVGFVFQQFNLLPYLSVLDNVLLACRFSRRRAARARAAAGSPVAAARRLLDHLGIGPELAGRASTALSIGQQQRVAVARALVGSPELLIADEPTSALDHEARGAFLELLLAECEAEGTTVLFVSHDPSLADWFDRQLAMDDLNRTQGRG